MREAIVIGLTAITCMVVIAFGRILSDQTLSSTTSPMRTYEVEITQKWFGIERYVYLNALRNGKHLVQDKLLFTGDWFDSDFKELYPNHSWATESILKIGRGLADTQSNELTIANGTGNRISYLLVETYEDKYVLFDVEPGAVINLGFKFKGQLSCEGEFAESKKRLGRAVRIENDEEGEVQGSFSISVGEEDVVIESPSVILKRVSSCAVERPGM